MFYIYILYSEGHNKYYVGHTDDIERRLTEHNALSDHSYTSRFRPWKLAARFEVGTNRGEARKIENHIKRQKSSIYIEELSARSSFLYSVVCVMFFPVFLLT